MEKEFVTYNQALALKELGFDEPCLGLYHNDKTLYPTQCKSQEQYHGQICSAPLYQQTFRWFRDKHGLDFNTINTNMWTTFSFVINDIPNKNPITTHLDFNTKEEAESACLDKLIEITKTK